MLPEGQSFHDYSARRQVTVEWQRIAHSTDPDSTFYGTGTDVEADQANWANAVNALVSGLETLLAEEAQ